MIPFPSVSGSSLPTRAAPAKSLLSSMHKTRRILAVSICLGFHDIFHLGCPLIRNRSHPWNSMTLQYEISL